MLGIAVGEKTSQNSECSRIVSLSERECRVEPHIICRVAEHIFPESKCFGSSGEVPQSERGVFIIRCTATTQEFFEKRD